MTEFRSGRDRLWAGKRRTPPPRREPTSQEAAVATARSPLRAGRRSYRTGQEEQAFGSCGRSLLGRVGRDLADQGSQIVALQNVSVIRARRPIVLLPRP